MRALVGLLLLSVAAAPAKPPNIVLIMADDLGVGHLGSYGQEKIRTPHLDRMAAEGMRFTQAYAGSTVCAPSRSVLMTGLHGGHTPVRGNFGDAFIADSDVTIAEVLKQAGYATGGYGKWGLGLEDSPGHPLRQGFDDFLGYLHQVHAHFYYPFWLTLNYGRMNLRLNENGGRGQYSPDLMMDRAIEFIRKPREEPFFAYLPVIIPHVEIAAPADSLQEYLGTFPEVGGGQEKRIGYMVSPNPRAAYAAMITRLDGYVGRVFDVLRDMDIDDETIVIFNSDNGAQSGFDVNEEFFDSTAGLRGYKGSMYEGGLRIPQIARWPGKIPAGSTTDHVTYFPDMMPTLAELAETEPPPNDGISIVPTLLAQGGQEEHDWLYWELYSPAQRAVARQGARHGDWKFVRQTMDEPTQLFNLAADPLERADLAAARPELIRQFEQWLAANRTEPGPYPERTPVDYRDYVQLAPINPAALGNRNWPEDRP